MIEIFSPPHPESQKFHFFESNLFWVDFIDVIAPAYIWVYRDQARGRLGRNGRPGGRNFALNGTQGEVGVSLKKKKKKKNFFFFFFFFLGRLIFILLPHKCKLW